MNTRILRSFAVGLLFCASTAMAQINMSALPVPQMVREGQQVVSVKKSGNGAIEGLNSNPLPASVAIPGSTPLSLDTKLQIQTDGRSMHNIQVDPSNPKNIHALVMSAPNVSEADTVSGGSLGGVYSTRNCFYSFSSNGGVTWSTPVAVAPFRSGFCDMVLYNNGTNYVPIIALHRWQSATNSSTILTAIYIEQGVPGAAKFKEFPASSIYPDGTTQNIIWPRIAVSPDNTTVYVAASVSPSSGTASMNITVGTYTIGEGGSATWNGWMKGPVDSMGILGSATGNQALAQANYAICVSPTGKVALAWDNNDYTSPDLGIYFAESSDKGKTWVSTFRPLWNTTDSAYQTTGAGGAATTVYLRPSASGNSGGLDMFYGSDGKVRLVSGLDWEAESTTNNTYVPNSGGIMFWNGDTNSAPHVLLSRLQGTSAGATAIDTGSFLSLWPGGSLVDPQAPNVSYPTLAPTTNPKKYEVFFECWANGDSEYVDPTNNVWFPYHSIYEKHTSDDGLTWSAAAPVLSNDPATTGQKYDYHYPETSNYNPSDFSNMQFGLMYMGDTAAGFWETGGHPVWDDVNWYFTTTKGYVMGVKNNSAATSFQLAQAYPNPFSTTASIAFNLANESTVQLTVTDALGRSVASLVNNKLMSKGTHSVAFNGTGLANGVYFYTLRANGETFTQRMELLK